LEYGGKVSRFLEKPRGTWCNPGAVKGYLPAAALDWEGRLSPPEALWPGESAVAAARVEPTSRRLPTKAVGIPRR